MYPRLIHFCGFDRLRRIGQELAVLVDEVSAVAQKKARPHRNVGVLEAARHEPGHAFAGIVELACRIDHLGEGLRKSDSLGIEQLAVVIHDPGIEIERQAVDAAVGLDGIIEAALREIVEVEIRIRERFVGDHRPQIGEPLVLCELPLLHVV